MILEGKLMIDVPYMDDWLFQYTWIQVDGSIDFSRPRNRQEGLAVDVREHGCPEGCVRCDETVGVPQGCLWVTEDEHLG